MKTNQIMTRKMGEFNVLQRTSDEMFNATDLLKQWNKSCNKKKDLDDFMKNKSTKDYINTIIIRENLNTQNCGELKVVKSSRGKYNGGTWMHKYLFFDFAMWLNPEFKYDVIKFVYDEMIKYRNDAGDAYKELSSAIMNIVPSDFMAKAMQKIGEALNWVIFNSHERNLRNKHGNEEKQRQLWLLEKKVADLINEGFITNFDDLISYLRKQYHKCYYPKVFQK